MPGDAIIHTSQACASKMAAANLMRLDVALSDMSLMQAIASTDVHDTTHATEACLQRGKHRRLAKAAGLTLLNELKTVRELTQQCRG